MLMNFIFNMFLNVLWPKLDIKMHSNGIYIALAVNNRCILMVNENRIVWRDYLGII